MAKSTSRSTPARAGATFSLHPQILILAAQAADQAALLAVMQDAYVALEKLVTHEGSEDAEKPASTRSGLGALMRALNGEMKAQIDLLVHATTALHAFTAEAAGVP